MTDILRHPHWMIVADSYFPGTVFEAPVDLYYNFALATLEVEDPTVEANIPPEWEEPVESLLRTILAGKIATRAYGIDAHQNVHTELEALTHRYEQARIREGMD